MINNTEILLTFGELKLLLTKYETLNMINKRKIDVLCQNRKKQLKYFEEKYNIVEEIMSKLEEMGENVDKSNEITQPHKYILYAMIERFYNTFDTTEHTQASDISVNLTYDENFIARRCDLEYQLCNEEYDEIIADMYSAFKEIVERYIH